MGIRRLVRAVATRTLSPLGLEVRTRSSGPSPDAKAWVFPALVEEARRLGLDVNDYEDTIDGWDPAVPRIEALLAPHLCSSSRVCEIGPGTGRWARHLAARTPEGEVHLVDHSPWLCAFLRTYFGGNPRVRVHENDGCHLQPLATGSLDLVYSIGSFVAMNLGVIMRYAQEMARVLRPGGVAVIDYIDVARDEGWLWLETQSASAEYAQIYTFHERDTIHRVLRSAGLRVVDEKPASYRTFLTLQAP